MMHNSPIFSLPILIKFSETTEEPNIRFAKIFPAICFVAKILPFQYFPHTVHHQCGKNPFSGQQTILAATYSQREIQRLYQIKSSKFFNPYSGISQ